MMDLVPVWYDDRYWSKILHNTIPTPIHDILRTFMLKFYFKAFRSSLFPNPVVYLFRVWYDHRCWSRILCSTILNPVHDFKVEVTDLEVLYWSLCLSFYNVCFCEAFDGLIHVWHGDLIETGPKFYMVPFPTQKVTDSEFLYKCFVINVLQFQFFCKAFSGFYSFIKFYAVPSQSQCMTLRSRSQTLNFFVLNLYSISCCKAFDWFELCLVWMDIRL